MAVDPPLHDAYALVHLDGPLVEGRHCQADGSVLCVRHAELLRLEDHSETMLGEVFEMDQWLESVDGQADESDVRRAEHHRNELKEQIRFNRARIELIRDELLNDHDETT